MLTARDVLIIKMLNHFRVLNRRQLERIAFPNLKSATPTANRVLKRLVRDGYILQLPQPKDRPYLYMPVPARIHHQSSKLEHFLGLADIYIALGQPKVFEIEPDVGKEYRPDAYTVHGGRHIVIEYQRTLISNPRMQAKLDAFFSSHAKGLHKANEIWIVNGASQTFKYKVIAPSNFIIRQIEKAPGA